MKLVESGGETVHGGLKKQGSNTRFSNKAKASKQSKPSQPDDWPLFLRQNPISDYSLTSISFLSSLESTKPKQREALTPPVHQISSKNSTICTYVRV